MLWRVKLNLKLFLADAGHDNSPVLVHPDSDISDHIHTLSLHSRTSFTVFTVRTLLVLDHLRTQASDVEIRVDDTLLIVLVNPYYLRLTFSHAVLEDEDSSARYDASSGELTLTLTKQVEGQDFKDLDLIAKLLAPPKSSVRPIIEVLSSQASPAASGVDEDHPERRQILEGES